MAEGRNITARELIRVIRLARLLVPRVRRFAERLPACERDMWFEAADHIEQQTVRCQRNLARVLRLPRAPSPALLRRTQQRYERLTYLTDDIAQLVVA